MTRSFVLTPESEQDALAIWERRADEDSERAADRLLARVYDECQKVGDTPGLGHYREDLLDRRYKFWSVHSYLIVYRWEVKPIEVVAIVHGARSLGSFLQRRVQ